MAELVLPLLLTVLPITGNQVAALDFYIHTLGHAPPDEIHAHRLTPPFSRRTQTTNFAILCASLDWDATRLFNESADVPDDLRVFSACYLSMPASSSSTRFLRLHANAWQTNWTATAVEEAVLKRLTIESPAEADLLLTKLAGNPVNARWTRWATWNHLVRDRRKAEAIAYAGRERLDTHISFGQTFPCLPFEAPVVQILWPGKVRSEVYQYSFAERMWVPQICVAPGKITYVSTEWKQPTGAGYRRSWKKGPSWQVTYRQDGGALTRTATYVESDSEIAGVIEGNNYSESVVEMTSRSRFFLKAPNVIEVQ